MNPVLDQFNALVTSMRMIENENEKLKSNLEKLEVEDNQIKADLQKAQEDLTKSEADFKELKEEHTKIMTNLDAELEKCKSEAALKEEEKNLYFDIKTLEKDIEALKKENEFLAYELDDVRQGKLTPNFSKYLQSKLNKDGKAKLLEHYGKTIPVERVQGIISMPTIERIFDATILYYSRDHIVRTYEERIERRQYLDDKHTEKYVEIAVRQLNDFDNAVDSAQLELLEKLGLTLDEFSQSIEMYFAEGNQEVYVLTSMIPQKLKMFMPQRKRLTAETVRNSLKFQKEILPYEFKVLDILKKYKEDLTVDRVTTLLSNRLLDKVYEKFNFEIEDFTSALQLPECRNDQEIKNLLLDIKNSIVEQIPKTVHNTFGTEEPVVQAPVQGKKK